MSRLRYRIVVLFMLPLLVSAQELAGTKWLLVGIDDLQTGIRSDVGSTVKVTMVFDSDSTYSGKFCSNYNGRFKYNSANRFIKMGTPSHTRMKCPGIEVKENEMLALLPQATKYRAEGDILFIFTHNQKRLSLKKDTGQNPAAKK